MKIRLLALFFIVMLFLSSCSGRTSPEPSISTSGSTPSGSTLSGPETSSSIPFGQKYDYIDADFIPYGGYSTSPYQFPARAVRGGALVYAEPYYFYSDTSIFKDDSSAMAADNWIGLYDEDNNTLVPLCFDPSCSHNSDKKEDKCFAQKFYGNTPFDFGVSAGEIFVMSADFSVSYYSFDGRLLRTISFPLQGEYRTSRDGTFREGKYIYFFVIPPGISPYEATTKFLFKYSIPDMEFSEVCRIDLDYPMKFSPLSRTNGVYYAMSDLTVYIFDMDSGSLTLYRDYLEAYSAVCEHIAPDTLKINRGNYNWDYSSIHFQCNTPDYSKYFHYIYDFETKTIREDYMDTSYPISDNYISYNGRSVRLSSVKLASAAPEDLYFALVDANTGDTFSIHYSYGDAKRRLNFLHSETEHGFIFQAYLRENQQADLGRLVWISKEDYFSGNWGNYKEINMMYCRDCSHARRNRPHTA